MRSLILLLLTVCLPALADHQELGLTLGGLLPQDRGSAPSSLHLTGGVALQANYGYRFWSNRTVALFGEVHFLANGQRRIDNAPSAATRDVATLYLTPGIRVKFLPNAAISPYVAAGAGYALYEQSFFQSDGAANPAPRFRHGGAFDFGGGFDAPVPSGLPLARYLSLRAEVRDFYSGNPAYNLPSIRGGQHNVVAGGGFVIRWGGR